MRCFWLHKETGVSFVPVREEGEGGRRRNVSCLFVCLFVCLVKWV
jgi:hypothetical protein